MDREREKVAIHEKLTRCRQLAKEYSSGPTATNLRELEAELWLGFDNWRNGNAAPDAYSAQDGRHG